MNKEVRRIREYNTFKGNRERTLLDVFRGLLVASDPIVSSYRKNRRKVKEGLPDEVKFLLQHDEGEN